MERVKDLLRQTFLTENALTMPVSAPGSAGMETCFVNLIEPSDTVLVCINGVFGGRMRENIERIGAKAVVLDQPWGEPVDPETCPQTAAAAFPDLCAGFRACRNLHRGAQRCKNFGGHCA